MEPTLATRSKATVDPASGRERSARPDAAAVDDETVTTPTVATDGGIGSGADPRAGPAVATARPAEAVGP